MTEEQKKVLAVALQGDGRVACVASWKGEARQIPEPAKECETAGWLEYLGQREPGLDDITPGLHTWKITEKGRTAYREAHH